MSGTPTLRAPKYRHHKPSGKAVVTLDGHDFYLGNYGSAASRHEYDRLVAEWLANGRRLPSSSHAAPKITLVELMAAYLRFAKTYYVKNGLLTSEVASIKQALRPLKRLYANLVAEEFGPLALKTVRQAMIEADWCRKFANDSVDRIRRMFRWAVENELLPVTVYQALKAVPGLRRGRSQARESEPVRPVPEPYIDAVRLHLAEQVNAMIDLQLLTAMRPGEVSIMRGADLDMSGKCWTYRPEAHKTEHHDKERLIHIGPKAQAIVRRFLKTELAAYLFNPRDAEAARNQVRRQSRQTPMTPSQAVRKPKKNPKRAKREHYDVGSYRRAIQRACDIADRLSHEQQPEVVAEQRIIPRWHPHQLRHNAATKLRKEFGIEVARIICGHHSSAVTEIYAEQDLSAAADIMTRVG